MGGGAGRTWGMGLHGAGTGEVGDGLGQMVMGEPGTGANGDESVRVGGGWGQMGTIGDYGPPLEVEAVRGPRFGRGYPGGDNGNELAGSEGNGA